jgi:hypothetical protein
MLKKCHENAKACLKLTEEGFKLGRTTELDVSQGEGSCLGGSAQQQRC